MFSLPLANISAGPSLIAETLCPWSLKVSSRNLPADSVGCLEWLTDWRQAVGCSSLCGSRYGGTRAKKFYCNVTSCDSQTRDRHTPLRWRRYRPQSSLGGEPARWAPHGTSCVPVTETKSMSLWEVFWGLPTVTPMYKNLTSTSQIVRTEDVKTYFGTKSSLPLSLDEN